MAGVTAIETKAGRMTEILTVPLIEPMMAAMTALPEPTPVANPVVEMLTMAGAEEVHETELVRSSRLPSENVPIAENCCELPREIEIPEGEIDNVIKTGELTTSGLDPLMAPDVALIFAPPTDTAVAKPPGAIVATVGVPELHAADAVTS